MIAPNRLSVWILNEAGTAYNLYRTGESQKDVNEDDPELEPLLDYLEKTNQPILFHNITQQYLVSTVLPSTRAAILLPMKCKDNTLGVILAEHPSSQGFISTDVELLSLAADHAALTIENIYQYKDSKQTSQWLRNILENSHTCITVVDSEGKVKLFNQGAANLTGYKPEEIIGKNIDSLYVDKRDFETLLIILNEEGKVENFETQIKIKNKEILDISITVSNLYDDNGQFLGSIGISTDITERNRLQGEIQKSHELLSSIISKAPISIQVLDEEGNTTIVNDAYLSLFEISNAREVI